MTSIALRTWRGRRAERLGELLDIHAQVRRIGRDSSVGTRQLELALIQRLASEFQGFARDLHDEAVEAVYAQMAQWNGMWAATVEQLLLNRRDLDRRNASPSTLGSDFQRFGLELWSDLIRRDSRNAQRQRSLEWLNVARNALAHEDAAKQRQLAEERISLDLQAFRDWRSAADHVAGAMDVVLAEHLARTLRSPVP